jgi:RHS repeat-associated protein
MSYRYDHDAVNECTSARSRMRLSINGLGQETIEIRNALDETVTVFDDQCGNLTYEYNAVGNLEQIIGVDGAVTTMTYDRVGRKVAMSDPDKGQREYAYNAFGEVTRQIDSRGQALDFSYDNEGRVIDRWERSGVSSLTDNSYTTLNHEQTTWKNSISSSSAGYGLIDSVTYHSGDSGARLHHREYHYDEFGRIDIVSTTIDSSQFLEQTTYDQFGRVFQQFDASGDDRGIRYIYENGYLDKLREAREGPAGEIYQDILAKDARGNVTAMQLGNGVEAFAEYDPASGAVQRLEAYDQNGNEIQDLNFVFDLLGNLAGRHDMSAGNDISESFEYDSLNRLRTVSLTAPAHGVGTPEITLNVQYDVAGNITYKSDIGSYTYGENAGPHAVTTAGSTSYSYDINGNQETGGGRSISYTVFDKAEQIVNGAAEIRFAYGIGHVRYQRMDLEGDTVQKTTTYLGTVERIESEGSVYYKRQLAGVAIATYFPASQVQQINYLLKDHIGSINTVLDETGSIVARMHFDAFGQRKDIDWQTLLSGYLYKELNDMTRRGFTGHEHADSVGIIHMNGRIYDPGLGRFLQADPIVQAPKNSQSLNRYSYVYNNPLSNIDPTGYFSLKKFAKRWGPLVIAFAISIWLPGSQGLLATKFGLNNALAQYVITGFVAGGITGGIKGALAGAFIAAVTYGVASAFDKFGAEQLVVNSNQVPPTEEQMNHLFGPGMEPESGLYRITVGSRGEFEGAASITAANFRNGDILFTNGISNSFADAVKNGTTQVAQLEGIATSYILNFNQTANFGADLIQTAGDIAGTYFGSGHTQLARNLANALDHAERNGITGLRLIGHSQGGAITASAIRYAADSGLGLGAVESVHLHGAPLNNWYTKSRLSKRAGVPIKNRSQFSDAVNAVFGGNFIANPLRLPASIVRSPHLFSSDSTLSPHSTPCGSRLNVCLP